MKDYGRVQGSREQALPLIIGKDTVYVHTNIVLLPPVDGDAELYEYYEIQYDKNEYLELIAIENMELNERLLSTQNALCEIYESINN